MTVDLLSDTHTLPTEGMRRAMATAEVGDEQRGEDPSTNLLQERVAALLGTEGALFLPTGSMCNKVAVAALTRPGDVVVCESMSHVMRFEGGGSSAISGVAFEPITTERGWFTADRLDDVAPGGNVYQPRASLVYLENTHNFAGGTVWPIDVYEDVAERAHGRGASVVTDGARLLNAVAASGVPADRWADPVDALWIDLSKGLGCPGGAVLAGSADFLDEANRWKFMLGGAMRQSGILAAAGLYALDHHVERLPEDHATAQRLAEGLADAGFAVEQPETNIVFFDSSPVGLDLEAAAAAFAERGIGVIVVAGRIRATTHLDVDAAGVDAAIAAARDIAA